MGPEHTLEKRCHAFLLSLPVGTEFTARDFILTLPPSLRDSPRMLCGHLRMSGYCLKQSKHSIVWVRV